MTDGQLAVVSRGPIDDDVTFFDYIPRHDDRELAITGTLRSAVIFSNMVGFNRTLNSDEAVIGIRNFFDGVFGIFSGKFDANVVGVATYYFTGVSSADDPTHRLGNCRLHTGADDRSFRL